MTRPALPLTRRTLLRSAAAVGVAWVAGCETRAPAPRPAPAASARLRLLGETSLPHGLRFGETTVGGLSGIDFDPVGGTWVALSDDRSELQPARFYDLSLSLSAGLVAAPLGVTTLRDGRGQPYPPRRAGGEVVDPEAIRLLPGGERVLWTSEGDPQVNQPPALRECSRDGSHVRDFELPPSLRLGRPGRGPRANASFEGLALTPDARHAWVAMEGPLAQDGPRATVRDGGGPCRFTQFDVAAGRAVRQIAYQPDAVPLPPTVPGTFADNGVSEILMLDADRMLVLERSYSLGAGNSLRLYAIDAREGEDTLAMERLDRGRVTIPAKRLVADFATLGLSRLDNTEGMAWGPRLPNGRRLLVVVSDDNFSRSQTTQFAAFEYLEDS